MSPQSSKRIISGLNTRIVLSKGINIHLDIDKHVSLENVDRRGRPCKQLVRKKAEGSRAPTRICTVHKKTKEGKHIFRRETKLKDKKGVQKLNEQEDSGPVCEDVSSLRDEETHIESSPSDTAGNEDRSGTGAVCEDVGSLQDEETVVGSCPNDTAENEDRSGKEGQTLKEQEDNAPVCEDVGSLRDEETVVGSCSSDVPENEDRSGTERQHEIGSLQDEETVVESCSSETSENDNESGTEEQHEIDNERNEVSTEGGQNTTCNDAHGSEVSVPSKGDSPCPAGWNQAIKTSIYAGKLIAATLLKITGQHKMSTVPGEDDIQQPPSAEATKAETFNRLISPFPDFINPAQQGLILGSTLRCQCSCHLGEESPGGAAPEVYISETVFLPSGSIHPLASTVTPSTHKQTEPQKQVESEPETGDAQTNASPVSVTVTSVPIAPARKPLGQGASLEMPSSTDCCRDPLPSFTSWYSSEGPMWPPNCPSIPYSSAYAGPNSTDSYVRHQPTDSQYPHSQHDRDNAYSTLKHDTYPATHANEERKPYLANTPMKK